MGNNSKGDAREAAETQGEQDRLTLEAQTWANRPDQVNPFGTLSWGVQNVNKYGGGAGAPPPPPMPKPSRPPSRDDRAPGEYQQYVDDMKAWEANQKAREQAMNNNMDKWTQTYTLNDDMQGFLDSDMANIGRMKEMQTAALTRAQQDLATGPDFEQFGDYQDLEFDPTELRNRAEDAVYQRQANRLNPRFEQERAQLESTLRNRGLREGDAAFDTALQNFNMSKNDAFEQARLGSIGEGRNESSMLFDQQMSSTDYANALRDRRLQDYLKQRNFNLDEAQRLDTVGKLDEIQNTYSGGG